MQRRRFGLGLKMGGGFGLLVVMMLLLGGMVIWRMRAVQRQAVTLEQEYVAEVALANRLQQTVLQTMLNMRGYALSENASYLEEARQSFAQAKDALTEAQTLADQSPHLEQLKEHAPILREQAAQYEQLMQETIKNITEIADIRATLDAAASEHLQSCYTMLQSQNESFRMEMVADLAPEQLSERLMKITLINEVLDLANVTRVATFKAQTLDKPDMLTDALRNFALIDKKVEELLPRTHLDEDIQRIDTIRAAAQTYQKAMNNLRTDWPCVE